MIRREKLIEMQVFDTFVEDYRQILNNIEKEHPKEEIIVNVSSGTPAMKSSLLILAILSDGKYLAGSGVHSEEKNESRPS